MPFKDRLIDDANTVFTNHAYFEDEITYTNSSGSSTFNAVFIDEFDLTDDGGLDADYTEGLASVAHFYISYSDVMQPNRGDTIDFNGAEYTVQQYMSQDGMWQVLTDTDRRAIY